MLNLHDMVVRNKILDNFRYWARLNIGYYSPKLS